MPALTILLLISHSIIAEEVSLSLVASDLNYGDAEHPDAGLQTLDIYYRSGEVKLPVVVYVHGGGWAFGQKEDVHHKPLFFTRQNIAFISMNYRLRWNYEIYDQAEDIVSVIKWIHNNAETYGLDKNKIVLMGHAAGAHLVSLVATNQNFVKAAGMTLDAITAVVAIDTVSYDIERLMIELGSFIERRQHRLIFGNEQRVWHEASPINHVESGKRMPSFALLYVADDQESTLQARAFAKALSTAGVETIMVPGNEKSSDTIDEDLGSAEDRTTQALMTFMRAKI